MRLIDILVAKHVERTKEASLMMFEKSLKERQKTLKFRVLNDNIPIVVVRKTDSRKSHVLKTEKTFLLKKIQEKLVKDKKRITIENLVINLIVLS